MSDKNKTKTQINALAGHSIGAAEGWDALAGHSIGAAAGGDALAERSIGAAEGGDALKSSPHPFPPYIWARLLI